MCGIVGVTGRTDTTELLINGLKKLEYRGYDSAGIYVNSKDGSDYLVKAKGKIKNLEEKLTPAVQGTAGIGHTRWATHGVPSESNSHPQFSSDNRFYLVHNGVIQNFKELKEEYLSDVKFASQTDTEVVVQLVDYFAKKGMDTKSAFQKTLSLLKDSSYAFVLMDREMPDTLFVAKNKSPLLIGIGDDFNVVCSDAMAMINVTKQFVELQDGEMVVIKPNSMDITTIDGQHIERKPFTVDVDASAADKGTYPYYMLKEIDEQPAVIRRIETKYFNDDKSINFDSELLAEITQASKIYIVGAGTSYHAGLVGKKLIEKYAKIPTEVVVASEFAYDDPIIEDKAFFIFLSQSGETADSRQVLVRVNDEWQKPSLTITNVANSTLAREAKFSTTIEAGPEIAVASTKAYVAQITVEALLAVAMGRSLSDVTAMDFDIQGELSKVANGIQTIVDEKTKIESLAQENLSEAEDAFFIGRGLDYYVALESALKLKEISYVHTEGFAAGELKHGTIALIEDGTPVIGIITQSKTASHTRSNLQEVISRGANVITFVSKDLAVDSDDIVLPEVDEILMPLISVVASQLLAYYTSLQRGYNVDQPRNLAKSVTVE